MSTFQVYTKAHCEHKLPLDKFSNDKTPAMLLKELGNLKMRDKEKVKDCNYRYKRLLNKFPIDVQLRDSITKCYYAISLHTNISVFVKRDAKDALALNFSEVIIVEKDLHSIKTVSPLLKESSSNA